MRCGRERREANIEMKSDIEIRKKNNERLLEKKQQKRRMKKCLRDK